GACVIMINNVSGAPTLSFFAGATPMITNTRERHADVNGVPARSYLGIRAVAPDDPDRTLFTLARGYFPPGAVLIYTLTGNYSGGSFNNLSVGTFRRVATDSMTFLRALTAELALTGGDRLIAAENIVAILETTGFDVLLQNTQFPLTLFAPTDEAVVEAANLYTCALANPEALRTLILNHITAGSFSPDQLISRGERPSMAGASHTFRAAAGGFSIDGVRVGSSEGYSTANGYVYLIDAVLVPDGFIDQYCTAG